MYPLKIRKHILMLLSVLLVHRLQDMSEAANERILGNSCSYLPADKLFES